MKGVKQPLRCLTLKHITVSGRLLERYFRDAGWKTPPEVLLIGLIGVSALVFTFILLITGTILSAIGAAVAVIILFFLYTRHRHDRSVLSFERQFADALGMVARSLRAGYPLLSGFKHATEELPYPVRDIFSEICQQQEMGVTIQEALRRAGSKYNTRDVRLFTAAAIIQIESGGNLAELMDRLSCVIRERMRIGRRIRVLTSQTKFSARTLIVLPFLVFFGMNILNPDYMTPLYSTDTGRMILAAGIASLLLGIWVMNRLSALRY